ncbi:MAG: hypothetical protein ACLRQF_05635 [Thomasclavelia ramosa]
MQAARAKLHHDMLHYIDEVTEAQLTAIIDKIGACVKRAAAAGWMLLRFMVIVLSVPFAQPF